MSFNTIDCSYTQIVLRRKPLQAWLRNNKTHAQTIKLNIESQLAADTLASESFFTQCLCLQVRQTQHKSFH